MQFWDREPLVVSFSLQTCECLVEKCYINTIVVVKSQGSYDSALDLSAVPPPLMIFPNAGISKLFRLGCCCFFLEVLHNVQFLKQRFHCF